MSALRRYLHTFFFGLVLCLAYVSLSVPRDLKVVKLQQKHETPRAKLIVGCSPEGINHFIPCSYHYSFEELTRHHGWDYYVPNNNSTAELVDIDPHVLLFCREDVRYMKGWPISILKDQGTKIALYIEDLPLFSRMHLKASDVRQILSEVDILVGSAIFHASLFYQPYFGNHTPELYWMPHSASSAFVNVTFNQDPKADIFFSGAVSSSYPIRQWISATYLPMNREKFTVHKHPGYSRKLTKNVTYDYAASIRSHLVAVSSTCLYRYVVAKTFEITATGSLLLTNLDLEEAFLRLGLVNGVHYVGFDDYDPSPTFEWVLDPRNRMKVDEICRNGMDFVRRYHTVSNRAHDLNDFFVKGTHKYPSDPLNKTSPCPMVTFTTNDACEQKFNSCCKVEQLAK